MTHETGKATHVAASIARWAAKIPKIRRVWMRASLAGGAVRSEKGIDIALELEPVGDSEETLAVWLANARQWRSQLSSRLSASFDLEWFDPDGSARTPGLDAARVLVYERFS